MTTAGIRVESGEQAKLRRYPGARSFEEWDQTQFRGRKRAAEELLLRVLSVRLLLQFAPSGVGKTSLLNAGLFPRLRAHNYFPFIVRVNRTDESLVQAVTRSMRDSANTFGLVDPIIPDGAPTLRELVAGTQLWSRDLLLLTPVLVFDQFEEIFTLRDAAFRRDFAEELGELSSGISRHEAVDGADVGLADGAAPVACKIVMSLREEYLGKLEEFSASIPDLFRERLRLAPLSNSEAREAIVEPARLAGDAWISPPFEFQGDCLDALIDFIDDAPVGVKIVDSLTLQLVCQRAETVAMQCKARDAGHPILALDDFEGRDGLERLVREYYLNELEKLPESTRQRARDMFEEGLLDPSGKRLMLEAGEIEREFRLGQPTLDQLVAGSLLRREPRNESVFYEISHDRLTETIAKHRERRLPPWVWPTIGAGALIMVVVLSITIYINEKRLEARDARDRAEYMLELLLSEDLVSRLRDSGLTDELKNLLLESRSRDSTVGYVKSVADVLKLRHEGDIAREQGTLKEARDKYAAALAVLDGLGHSAPAATQPTVRAERARILARQGSLLEDGGALAQAENNYRSAVELWDSVLKTSEHSQDLIDAAMTRLEFGDLLYQTGDHDGALSNFLQGSQLGIQICRAAHKKIRHDIVDASFELEQGLRVSADAALRIFTFEGDQETAKASVSLAREAVRRQPFSYLARQQYATAFVNTQPYDDNPESWAPRLERSRRQFDSLVRSEPDNRRMRREYAALQVVIAQHVSYCAIRAECRKKLSAGAVEEAMTATMESTGIFRMLAGFDPENRSLTDDVAWGLQTQARLLSAGTNPAIALPMLDAAIETARRAKVEARDFGNVIRVANLLEDKGRIQQDLDPPTEALASWDKALAELDRMPAGSDTTTGYRLEILDYKIAFLRRKGQLEDANRLQQDRDKINAGYKSPWVERMDRARQLNTENRQSEDKFKPQGSAADLAFYRRLADEYDRVVAENPFDLDYWWNAGQTQSRIAIRAGKTHEAAATAVSTGSASGPSGASANLAVQESALDDALFAVWMAAVLAPETGSTKYWSQVYEKRRELAIFLHNQHRHAEAHELAEVAAKDADEFARIQREPEARPFAAKDAKPMQDVPSVARDPQASNEALFYLADASFGLALTRAAMGSAGWEEAYNVAIMRGEQLAKLEPDKAEHQTWLGTRRGSFADTLQKEKRMEDAANQRKLALDACREGRRLAHSSEDGKEADECLADLAALGYK
jgi:tetratricopeptide (TPR) repeat protein